MRSAPRLPAPMPSRFSTKPSDQICALITDIRLGTGPDGWDLARHARELNARLPIVYMSGDSSQGHSARGVPDSLMIQKPFAPAQIVTAISTLLNAVAALPAEAPPEARRRAWRRTDHPDAATRHSSPEGVSHFRQRRRSSR